MKSTETSGALLTATMSFNVPAAASRNAVLMPSTVTGLFVTTVTSTSETFGTGTRMAMPRNLPSSSGMTFVIARTAPVVVGMMDSAAALARLRSRCGASRRRWLLV